ncbi:hypothetical protein GCM10023340_18680 [Nocardioides marinquilinus]|uniref:D-alanyl-D-alanine carboxypeptidase/D-alanyl-D-alanine-endopeptidase n=1 Tax=Nocardioides marinquilinus TaxID=1210400 RepID=A0ABP9PKN6_9ACTN
MARSGSATRATLVLVLLLALVAGGVAVVRYDPFGWLDGDDAAGPADDPATIEAPEGVDAPEVTPPGPVAAPATPRPDVDAAAVREAVAPYLADRKLGRHVLAEVAPLAGGEPVFVQGRDTAIPASTTKVVTSTAALLALGPDHVFTTQVRAAGRGRVVLVGGGDPFLERADVDEAGLAWPYPARATLDDLAADTAAALKADGIGRVRLDFDDTLFTGPAENPRWEPGYITTEEVAPISALWVDEGRERTGAGRVADPAAEAAASFAEALVAAGVRVVGTPRRRAAGEGRVLASVDSAPLAGIVERILDVSDNEGAETLLRHVGLAVEGDGSTEAGRRGVRSLLAEQGVRMGPSVFYDGSGLSRQNRADPSFLVDVLRLAASDDQPDLRPVISGLPVAGFTGSLADRMDQGPRAGLGRVRAKTGTLGNVSSLAGLATDLDGNVLVFVLMADRVREANELDARVAQDSAAAALGACRCSGRRS